MAKGNVGDRVRVVDAMTGEAYADGDVGTITRIEGGSPCADVRLDSIGYHHEDDYHYLHACEYEIIGQEASIEADQEDGTIPWAVGQEVFCLLRGKGVVSSVQTNQELWGCGVTISFPAQGMARYNLDGKVAVSMNRSLFFSEPQIIADKLPPKKPFIPTFKRGDQVLIIGNISYPEGKVFTVYNELEDKFLLSNEAGMFFMKKDIRSVQLLGSKVEFNI